MRMRPQHMPHAAREPRAAVVMRVEMVMPMVVMACVVLVAHGHMMTRKSRCSISTITTSGNRVTAVFANSLP
jgi:hypothetical protein